MNVSTLHLMKKKHFFKTKRIIKVLLKITLIIFLYFIFESGNKIKIKQIKFQSKIKR